MNSNRWYRLALAAVAALAFAAGRWSARPSEPFDPTRDLASIRFDWLGLTPAQAAEIERLKPAYSEVTQSACDARCTSRCRLVHSLTAVEWNGEQARAAVKAMCEDHERIELASLQFVEEVRQILSPEQRARLMQRIGECLCKQCANNRDSDCCLPSDSRLKHRNKE